MPAGRCSDQVTPETTTLSACSRRRLVIIPVVVGGLLAGAYALMTRTTWQATEAIVIRVQGAARVQSLGEPSTLDQLTLAADTIDEVAHSPEVLAAVLRKVEPAKGKAPAQPTAKEIAALRSAVRLSAPREIDSGDAEVINLRVKNRNRERALALVTALGQEVAEQSQQLISQRAKRAIEQLCTAEAQAADRLRAASQQLAQLEQKAGANADELRNSAQSSASAPAESPQTVESLASRIRLLEETNRNNRAQLKLLQDAANNPTELASTPSSVLDAQPALRRLKDELDDAQLRGALLRGTMSDQHPQVEAADANEKSIRQQLESELAGSIEMLDDEIAKCDEQLAALRVELQNAQDRADKLPGLRSEYATLSTEVQVRTEALKAAQKRIADARSNEAKARHCCTIQIQDPKNPTVKVAGFTRLGIFFRGLFGGALVGLGLFYLTRPKPQPVAETAVAAAPPVDAAPLKSVASDWYLPQDDERMRESLRRALSSRF